MASPYALDFSPITNALAGARKHELALQEQAMERERLGFARAAAGREAEMFPYKKQEAELQLDAARKAAQQQAAQRALAFWEANSEAYGKLPPEQQATHWNTFLGSKFFDDNDRKMFGNIPGWNDPVVGPKLLLAYGSKYRDPLEKRALTAKAGEDEASAELKRAQAAAAAAKPSDTFDLGPDHTRYQQIRNPDGTITARPVATGASNVDATTKKAIDEADDFILQNKGALNALKQALQLNEKAYDGALASGRAQIVNNTWSTENAKATTLLENVITQQALQSLRSTFGGNPTEGERKILLDVAGSVNQPRAVREQIYRQAQAMAEARLKFNEEKAKSLRGGSYYKPGGQPEFKDMTPAPAPAGGPLKRVTNDADYDALPSGARYIAPDGSVRTKR